MPTHQTLSDLYAFYDGPVPQHLLDAAKAATVDARRREINEQRRDPEGYWRRRWRERVAAFRAQLADDRAALAVIRAERGNDYRYRRRTTLRHIAEDRQELRGLATEWLDHFAASQCDPRAIVTPLSRIYCCIEAEFVASGGAAQDFAVAVRTRRQA